jgi:hypothetical protein
MDIDTCVEETSIEILRRWRRRLPRVALAMTRGQIPARTPGEIRPKNRRKRQWQIRMEPALKAEVNSLQRSMTHQLNQWPNDQWYGTLEVIDPVDQSLWKMTRMIRVPTSSPPLVTPGGTALSDPEKTEALAGSLGSEFQPINNPLYLAVIEKVTEALQA